MSRWPQVTLGEHVDMIVGFPFKSAQFQDSPSGGARLLRGDNVGQGLLRWDGAKHWPKADDEQYSRFELAEGDVILAMDRPWIEAGLKFAYVRRADLPCLLVQRVARMRGTQTLDTDFLRYIIASPAFTGHVKGITTGVNVPHISGRDISRFTFALPPLETQCRIAAILGAYDDLIEVNRRRVAVLEAMARGLFEEWFVRFRFPGHEAVPILDTPDGPLPQGWKRTPFSSLGKFINGFAFKPSHFEDCGLPVVKIPELKNGVSAKTPRNSGVEVPQRLHIKNADLLFSWSGTLAISEWTGGDALLNQHLFLVIPQADFGRGFLKRALIAALPQFDNQGVGATMKHIRRSALDQTTVAVPTDTGLIQQANFLLETIYKQVVVTRQQNQALAASRDLLLPRLISGQLSVTAAERELEDAA